MDIANSEIVCENMDPKKAIHEIGTQVNTMLAMGYMFSSQIFYNIFLLFGHESGYRP
jgi:hypothetical protein